MKEMLKKSLVGEVSRIHIEGLHNVRLNDLPGIDPMEVGVSDCTAQLGIPIYEILRFIYPKPVYRLMACLASATTDDLFDDNSYITLELEGGTLATIVLSKTALLHEHEISIRVEGTLATMEWSSRQADVRLSVIVDY